MINKVTLVGNLGKDPELKRTTGDVAITNFSLATSEGYKDSAGEWKNVTEWHNITCWRELAERAAEQFKKGDQVYIEGKLKTDKYDKDGVTHFATKIVANKILSLGGKKSGS